jgi:dienelactone hydrolase
MKSLEVSIPVEPRITVKALLNIPDRSDSLVIFSHGSGSSRYSVRNKFVAELLNKDGVSTLLADLLTEEEDRLYENRFDIELLTRRLVAVTNYARQYPDMLNFSIGYFGASTGAASAIKAAAIFKENIHAVVSRGGRPDLAKSALAEVTAPTLLIVGSLDQHVLDLNRDAFGKMRCIKDFRIIEGASHLFEEPGKLFEAAHAATAWFQKYLAAHVEAK